MPSTVHQLPDAADRLRRALSRSRDRSVHAQHIGRALAAELAAGAALALVSCPALWLWVHLAALDQDAPDEERQHLATVAAEATAALPIGAATDAAAALDRLDQAAHAWADLALPVGSVEMLAL